MPDSKIQLRRSLLSRRKDLSPALQSVLSALVLHNLKLVPGIPWDGAILLYAPIRGEVDTEAVRQTIRKAGGRTLYPRVEGEGLGIYQVESPERDLSVSNRFRIPEPNPGVCPKRKPSDVDLVLVPGAVFDLNGYRIGYGLGFYDRFVPNLRKGVPRWGMAYDFQMVRDVHPEEKDQPLTGVVTDREVYCRGRFEFLSDSVEATERLAGTVGEIVREHFRGLDAEPCVFALTGDLGAGKTCFTKGLAAGLRCQEIPVSPTFTLIRAYKGDIPLQHVDLYRLKDPPRNDDALLFEEVFRSPGVVAIEWADRYIEGLPLNAVPVQFEWVAENRRRITLSVYLHEQLSLIRELHKRVKTGEAEIKC